MNLKRLNYRPTPRPGEVWNAKNIEYKDKIGVKSRPVIVIDVDGETVRYCKCTTNTGVTGSYHILDPISAGLHKETYVVPRIEKIGLNRLVYRYGILCRFDKDAINTIKEA